LLQGNQLLESADVVVRQHESVKIWEGIRKIRADLADDVVVEKKRRAAAEDRKVF
jgi:hypothetical protein